jgi:hypothetical protein
MIDDQAAARPQSAWPPPTSSTRPWPKAASLATWPSSRSATRKPWGPSAGPPLLRRLGEGVACAIRPCRGSAERPGRGPPGQPEDPLGRGPVPLQHDALSHHPAPGAAQRLLDWQEAAGPRAPAGRQGAVHRPTLDLQGPGGAGPARGRLIVVPTGPIGSPIATTATTIAMSGASRGQDERDWTTKAVVAPSNVVVLFMGTGELAQRCWPGEREEAPADIRYIGSGKPSSSATATSSRRPVEEERHRADPLLRIRRAWDNGTAVRGESPSRSCPSQPTSPGSSARRPRLPPRRSPGPGRGTCRASGRRLTAASA